MIESVEEFIERILHMSVNDVVRIAFIDKWEDEQFKLWLRIKELQLAEDTYMKKLYYLGLQDES